MRQDNIYYTKFTMLQKLKKQLKKLARRVCWVIFAELFICMLIFILLLIGIFIFKIFNLDFIVGEKIPPIFPIEYIPEPHRYTTKFWDDRLYVYHVRYIPLTTILEVIFENFLNNIKKPLVQYLVLLVFSIGVSSVKDPFDED